MTTAINSPEPAVRMAAADLARLLGGSVRPVWRPRDAGTRPSPLKLGTKLDRWRRDAILRWMDSRSHSAHR